MLVLKGVLIQIIFFLTDTINFLNKFLVDPIKNSDKDEEDKIYINKGLWSSKIKKKNYTF